MDVELGSREDHRAGLQRRLDAAQRRRAVHPHRRDPAAAARQHGPPRRRDHGAARAREHPGVDRHPDPVQHPARLPADADRGPARLAAGVDRGSQPPRLQGLLGQRERLRRQPAQGLLGRRGDTRERLLLRLPAEDHRRPRHLPHRARHDRRQGEGLLPARPEPRRRVRARQGAAARHGQPRLAGRPRPVRDRERDVLEERPRDRDRRDRPGGVPHRGVPAARRLARREGGHVHPDAADAAVAREGRRAGRRLPLRAVVLLPPRPDDPRAARRVDRGQGPSGPGPQLGLPRARRVRRAQRRGRPHGDQRLRGRVQAPAVGVHRDEGRRVDARRLLDLHRRLRRRGQPGGPPQARQGPVLGRSGVGLGVAGQPAHPLQPRVGGPRGAAVVGAEGLRLVGPRQGRQRRVDRARRTGLPEDQAAVLPRAGGQPGRRRHRGRGPVHHAGRRQGRALRAEGADRRPDADALRAGRVTVPEPALRPAGEPDAQGVRARRQPDEPEPAGRAQRRVPVRVHHQPAHRAPHGRRDEPLPGVPLRAAAVDVRRGLARARRAAGARAHGLVPRGHRTRRGRGPGARHRPAPPAADRGADRAPGLAALPLGQRRPGHRRLDQRPVRDLARPQRADPGEQGRHLRRAARPPADRHDPARLRAGLQAARRADGRELPRHRHADLGQGPGSDHEGDGDPTPDPQEA